MMRAIMRMRWVFGMSGRDVHLQARVEGPAVGDAYHTVRPGEKFLGISYAEFKAARAGVVIVEDDRTARRQRISTARPTENWQGRLRYPRLRAASCFFPTL